MPKQRSGSKLSDAFRQVALGMPGAVEGAHMGHADFRTAGGKIFATLNHDETLGVVMFTPEEQREFVEAQPTVFVPLKGGWGAHGATHVQLAEADEIALHESISTAWRRISAASPKARKVAKPKGRSPLK